MLLGTCRIWRGPVTAVNGAGWSPASPDISNTGNCAGYINGIAVAPGVPDVVYAVNNNGNVWQSQNATASSPTWTNITAYPMPQRPLSAVAVAPNDSSNVFVAAQGFDTGHIFRRWNGVWTDISGNLPNVPANAIVIDPQQPLNIYLATDAGVYMTNDGGTPQSNWQLLGTGLPNTAVVEIKIAPTSPRTLIAATHGRGAWGIALDGAGGLAAPTLTRSGKLLDRRREQCPVLVDLGSRRGLLSDHDGDQPRHTAHRSDRNCVQRVPDLRHHRCNYLLHRFSFRRPHDLLLGGAGRWLGKFKRRVVGEI